MSENKICPIMSRPKDCDPINGDNDRSIVEKNGFYIIDDVPWENVFLCQREKCMAWYEYEESYCLLIGSGSND